MSSKLFEKLLQDSKSLVDSNENDDSSKLQRELGQIASESFLLKSKFNTGQGLDATAHYFLAQSGTNTQGTIEKLNSIDTRVTFQPKKKVPTNDVESYLKQVNENIVIATVEESNSITRTNLLDRLDDNLHSDWKYEKRQILEEWDYEEEDKKFGCTTGVKDKKIQDMNNKTISYAKIIKQLNDSRLLSEKFPIINKCKTLSTSTQCDKSQERSRADSWSIVSSIANESKGNSHRVGGEFVHDCRVWIASSKRWLETEYQTFMNDTLNNNASEARVGGCPSLMHRIYSFMKLIFMKNASWVDPMFEVDQEYPIWLFTYLLIRSGHSDLALAFVEKHVNSFHESPEFPPALKEYLKSSDKTVSDETSKKLLEKYQEMVYGNVRYDPYKILLYKVIGRCEVEKANIPTVIRTAEDYLWLELSLVRESVHEKRYRLSDFQKKITAYGSTHFDPNGKNPWFYFKVLLLSLQFERAIDYLHKLEEFRLEAVHFAISFAYYGLIRIPSDPLGYTVDLLVTEPDGNVSLNFARIINQYVRLFVSDHAEFALQYLYLITLYSNEDMTTICREYIANYIAGRTDYKSIIGSVDKNYAPLQQGSIAAYKPLFGIPMYENELYRNTILSPIAQKFQRRGKYTDAVNVYVSSGNYTEALQVLNFQLDHTLNMCIKLGKIEGHQVDHQLIDFCVSTLQSYESGANNSCDSNVLIVNHTLLRILKATLHYERHEYEQVVELIKSTNIFPESSDFSDIQIATARFNNSTPYSIRKHIDHVLIIVMESYSKLCDKYSQHNLNLHNINQMNIAKIKKEAVTVMSFVALIDYKIPAEIVVKLNKQDILSTFN
ncbi:hypothetical protein INT47_005935 [Mucor saturninus]|uniref:Nuclear pore protein n=1 Tax=Mucor saturninus TaxID=64648 RepID=A0A8H7R8D0_9FUNG|nr:hypothetical protein INT47_005935 [Mucor saturninus]